jgi:23S rRNA (guanosine2251-2'-O)-methyltransferase
MKGHEMLVYGVHAAQAALKNPNRKVTAIWVSDIGSAHLEDGFDAARHPEAEVVTKRDIEHKLPAGAVHQGIAIAVEPLDDVYLSDILTAANTANADRSVVVVLDEVTDPHNVGAVLRSMAMFGAKAMIVHKRNAPSITGVMAKIATGAIEHVPMVAVTNLSQALEEMKLAGFYCLGLDENATISLGEVPTDRHIALVLGNEGEGLRAKTRTTCDAIVSIESFGAIKSLNVSNAAAIALYSITKK